MRVIHRKRPIAAGQIFNILFVLLARALLFTTSINAVAASLQAEKTMGKPWWLLAAVLGIGLILGGRWVIAVRDADARQEQASAAAAMLREQAATQTEQGRHEYVLEVVRRLQSFYLVFSIHMLCIIQINLYY